MIPLRRLVFAFWVASTLDIALPARADLPVIDISQLLKWTQQAQQMQLEIQQLEYTVRSLTNIPQNLINQVEGLLNIAVQNPLQNVLGNLNTLMNGAGTGTCPGSANILTLNQYQTAGGRDFLGSWINGGATRTAGLMACTGQMLEATQTRLNDMPQLLTELQSCADVSCATAVSGRIQLETATISAQQQQAILIGQQAQFQRWTAEDQVMQKQRSDAEAVVNGTVPGAAGGTGTAGPISATEAPVFNAVTFGGGG